MNAYTMKLPLLSFFKKAVPQEYFLALLLQDEVLQAVVFEENAGVIHIVGRGQHALPAPLDDTSFEELLHASDKAITAAESSLPSNTQSHKTIFGVKENWTEDLQISKDHLATLKKLCEELDLQPIGFLVFAEAIAHLLQKEEGAPVSAVLAELGTTHITATLLRAGRVIGSRQAAAGENLPKAVDALLASFTDVEILPSRIILLDNLKRGAVLRQFTNHSWSKQLPFLHVPQVTPLTDGFEIQAILFGTATQMGFEMAGLPEVKEIRLPEESNKGEGTEETKILEETKNAVISGSETTLESEKDAAGQASGTTEQPEPFQSAETEPSSGDAFGFVKDKDVLENSPDHPVAFDNFRAPDDESIDTFANETFADIPEEVKEDAEGLHSHLPGLGANAVMITGGMQKVWRQIRKVPFSSFFSPLKKLPGLLPKNLPGIGSSRKIVILIPLILLLCIGAVVWYIFGLHATANLIIDPKIMEKSQGVTFSSTNSTDISSDTIGGTTTPITENGSTSTPATGSQDVGDKAKGTVTIFNLDPSNPASLSAGTTIASDNGKKFSLDQAVNVPNSDASSGTVGKANVNVTAGDIGPDYNLPSGTKFTIGGQSTLGAKNDNAFSGGTKKTVTVVSQKDLDKLTADLTKNLGDKAKQDAQNNNGSKTVFSTFLSTDMSNQKFDHKLGDQTSSVSFSATITYQALSYDKSDLTNVAVAIMQSDNPNEDISTKNVSETIKNPTVSSDGKNITASLDVKAGILPKVDTVKTAQQLTGKPFSTAYTALSTIPQLASVRSSLSPELFFLPKTFPRIASHITVIVTPNE